MAVAVKKPKGIATASERKQVKVRKLDRTGKALRKQIKTASTKFTNALEKGDKAYIRRVHLRAKKVDEFVDYEELIRKLKSLGDWFPHPSKVVVENIKPKLIRVEKRTLEEKLFKICRGYWSMPYSKGYGRRLRYLIVDEAHHGVMGIIGLQSPPADLSCRDDLMEAPSETKLILVNSTLDAYTVGAMPPYSGLLGGKLIAGLLCSETIARDYWRMYGRARTQMLNRRLPQPLLAVTTTSAFGKSSIYNRVKYHDRMLAEPIGFTKGFGTIHLEHLYDGMECWLKRKGLFIPPGYGNGPKVRWQNIVRAGQALSIPQQSLRHGLNREVFLFRHVANLTEVCRDGATPERIPFLDDDWFKFWLKRWAIPRAERCPEWINVNPTQLVLDALREGQ